MNQSGNRGQVRRAGPSFSIDLIVAHGMIRFRPRRRSSVGSCATCATSLPRSSIVASLPGLGLWQTHHGRRPFFRLRKLNGIAINRDFINPGREMQSPADRAVLATIRISDEAIEALTFSRDGKTLA